MPHTSYRWNPRRKLAVLEAIAAGRLTLADAYLLHALGPEEIAEWQRRFAADGLDGLKVSGNRLKAAKPPKGEPPK